MRSRFNMSARKRRMYRRIPSAHTLFALSAATWWTNVPWPLTLCNCAHNYSIKGSELDLIWLLANWRLCQTELLRTWWFYFACVISVSLDRFLEIMKVRFGVYLALPSPTAGKRPLLGISLIIDGLNKGHYLSKCLS